MLHQDGEPGTMDPGTRTPGTGDISSFVEKLPRENFSSTWQLKPSSAPGTSTLHPTPILHPTSGISIINPWL
jgi:hypothetical protein